MLQLLLVMKVTYSHTLPVSTDQVYWFNIHLLNIKIYRRFGGMPVASSLNMERARSSETMQLAICFLPAWLTLQ